MPNQKSNVKNFILDAWMSSKYPKTIFRENDIGCFRIHLLNQHNKEKAKETTTMLEDYAKLKPRKENDCTSNRQRFIQALKRSPYIEILPCSTNDMKYIFIKEKSKLRPGNNPESGPTAGPSTMIEAGNSPESGPTAGPSTMTEADARNVPQMTLLESLEFPPTPMLHEGGEDMECTITPPETPSGTPTSPLPDFEEGIDLNLIGFENLIASNAQSSSNSSLSFDEVFNSDWLPDLSDLPALDLAVEDIYPSDYDPTDDFIRSLNSQPEQDAQDYAISSSENQTCEITDAQWIQSTENGYMVLGPVDSDGMDRSGCAVMISLRPWL